MASAMAPQGDKEQDLLLVATTTETTTSETTTASETTTTTGTSDHDDASPPSDTNKPTVWEFMQNFDYRRFVDPKEPWVLVEQGSFLGYFDWVPQELRVGPWSMAALCYLYAFFYLTVVAAVYYSYIHPTTPLSSSWWAGEHPAAPPYPAADTWEWTYHATALTWMMFVTYFWIVMSPLSYRSWATYTVQSWTLLVFRHGLCVAAPWSDMAARWAEYTRFPVACSTTITFVTWNFILMPVIYFGLMKTPEAKRAFFDFCFSFRMLQLHGLNIVYAVVNILWASPPRQLEPLDLLAAVGSVLVYIAFYLFCLDRVGIHFYPIFSPRHGWLVVTAWTSLILVYLGTFWLWQRLLAQQAELAART